MVTVTIEGENAEFEVEGLHKLWSLRSRLTIPLEHIKGAHVDPNPNMGWFNSVKLAGSGIPHVFQAGIFLKEGRLVFWDVRHAGNAIVVELENENFGKLEIEVADPAATVEMLNAAIAKK